MKAEKTKTGAGLSQARQWLTLRVSTEEKQRVAEQAALAGQRRGALRLLCHEYFAAEDGAGSDDPFGGASRCDSWPGWARRNPTGDDA